MFGRYGSLVRRNLVRNPRRSALTSLSLAASTFLVVTLEALLAHLDNLPSAEGSERRLVVRHATSFMETLPESFGPRVLDVPGVQGICSIVFYLAIWRDLRAENFFAKIALDPDRLRENYPETRVVDPETGADRVELFEDFKREKRAASAGIALFQKYGWKLGDTVSLRGVGFPDVELTLRSCYDGPEHSTLFFHRDYLDDLCREQLPERAGRVSFINVICKSIDDLPIVSAKIDAMFANSDAPTVTETEKAFQAGFVQLLGNVRFLLRSIALACAFAMICVAANTLAMTARERATDIAILKTLGFTPGRVLGLLLVEVAILCVVAAAVGAFGAKLLFSFEGPWLDIGGGFLRSFHMSLALAFAALPFGVLVGWVSAIVPFARVAYAPIAASLRRSG
ncbi:MAG: ABC transporter permease [Planctomycetes bacterium]|nr:ABC transporter permease [Planctomycetota bacterium]MBI3844401.1 ABC transporter permease [Planctomycetota bacterium]